MASPQLLDAAIRSDGVVREAPYTLLCMVLAVERASVVTTEDVVKLYLSEREVTPFERVLQAADEFSLLKSTMNGKEKLKGGQKMQEEEEEDEESTTRASSGHVQADLERLLRSTSRVETRSRLGEQLETLILVQIRELTGVSPPKHLEITTLEEDPLEFRRDTHGVAQVCGALGWWLAVQLMNHILAS